VAQILVQWAGNRPSSNRCPSAPTLRGMKGTAWRVYLGIGALATGAYYLLPYDPAGAVLNVVVGASAVAAIAAGLRWHRPVRRLPWG
jgi:hypothetical protein